MLDALRYLVQNLPPPEALAVVALQLLGVLALLAAVAVLLACAGFVLAQCCRGDRGQGVGAVFVILLAATTVGGG